MELDFRVPLIRERLSGLRLVVPVASPKGGVGKTTIASALSVLLARRGVRTGVLDLDFTNPTTHIMLGVDAAAVMPEEEKGVLPVRVEENLELMGVAFYTRDKPLPLRGRSVVDALREVLAVTRWSSQVLVVDSPPGLSDALLEMLRLARGSRVLVVSACDRLSLVSTRRVLEFLRQEGVPSLGVVANMCDDCSELEAIGVKPLDCVQRFEQLQRSEGDRDLLAELFSQALTGTVSEILRILG
ncbi:P-loop NTPase [Infirmifilum sp. SLHALR2]|nr:MAG: hypothetical protein B7L53_00220 [Thermofilum sp. NZ13]